VSAAPDVLAPPPTRTEADAHRVFSTSLLISATRCLLTYVVFPFVAPALGFATGVGPVVGIVIGVVAIFFNVLSIRRFHRAGHRHRWIATYVSVAVIGLLVVLLVEDVVHLVT
jgi:hypothetical protein